MARVLLSITDRLSVRGQVVASSVLLLCVSFLLTAYTSKHPEVARSGSTVLAELSAPLGSALEGLRSGARRTWQGYVALTGVAKENNVMRDQLHHMQGELSALAELRQENTRLRALLNFEQQANINGIAASVIGNDPTGWVRELLINRGQSNGIRPGMAVVTAHGVVGQVVSSSPSSSKVLLITDPSSGVDALIQESRVRGVVEGAGSDGCELQYVTKDSPVRAGEVVVTSGLDGVYPKGLIVGTVARVGNGAAGLFQEVILQPAVDLQKLEEVLVVPQERLP